MRFLEDQNSSADEQQSSSDEPYEAQMRQFNAGVTAAMNRQLELKPKSLAPAAKEERPSRFYLGQFTTVAGFWTASALIPWLTGQPTLELAGYPVGVAATIFLPFSIYFATVVNPAVPAVQKPYGIEYTHRNGRRWVIGLRFERPMTRKERQELNVHNAKISRQKQNRLQLERFERRQLRRAKRAEQGKQSLSSMLRAPLKLHRKR